MAQDIIASFDSKPPRCTNLATTITAGEEIASLTRPYYINGPSGFANLAVCFPDKYQTTSAFFYSPAVNCPTGFTTACSTTSTNGTVTNTDVVCCPTNFIFSCANTGLSRKPPFDTLGCSVSTTSSYAAGTSSVFDVGAFPIQIRHQASDGTPTTPSSGAITSAATAGSKSVPTTVGPTAAVATVAGEPAGPSLGAAVGISIFATLGILAVVGAAFYLGRRNRRRRDEARAALQVDGSYQSGGGMYGTETPATAHLSVIPAVSPNPSLGRYEDSPMGTASEWKMSPELEGPQAVGLGIVCELDATRAGELDGTGKMVKVGS